MPGVYTFNFNEKGLSELCKVSRGEHVLSLALAQHLLQIWKLHK